MFLDFPQNEAMFHLDSQFMFGDNILVAPKLNNFKQVAYLPYEAEWYNLNTKLLWTECSPFIGVWPVMEMPVFYRAGSIIPILLHENSLSLLRAINNNIELEVFPTRSDNAEGKLVLDDGWSTKTDESRYVFKYELEAEEYGSKTYLKMQVVGDLAYTSGKLISSVSIYGVKSAPFYVFSFKTMSEVDFTYDSKTESIKVPNLNIPLDQKGDSEIYLLKIYLAAEVVIA